MSTDPPSAEALDDLIVETRRNIRDGNYVDPRRLLDAIERLDAARQSAPATDPPCTITARWGHNGHRVVVIRHPHGDDDPCPMPATEDEATAAPHHFDPFCRECITAMRRTFDPGGRVRVERPAPATVACAQCGTEGHMASSCPYNSRKKEDCDRHVPGTACVCRIHVSPLDCW